MQCIAPSRPPSPAAPEFGVAEAGRYDFHALVGAFTEPAWVLDNDRVVWVNRALCVLLGHSDDKTLVGRSLSELVFDTLPGLSGGRSVGLLTAQGVLRVVERPVPSPEVGPRLEILRVREARTGFSLEALEALVDQLLEGGEHWEVRVLETIARALAVDVAVLSCTSEVEGSYTASHVWSPSVTFQSGLVLPLGASPACAAARTSDLIERDVTLGEVEDGVLRCLGWRLASYVGVGVVVAGATVGTLDLYGRGPIGMSAGERRALPKIAQWLGQALESARTLGELRQAREQLEELARTDLLTHLPNRRSALETAHREVVRSRRYATPVCIAIVDIDNFQLINDSLGNDRADQVISAVGKALVRNLREVDLVGRFGGQQFLIVLPNTDAWQVVVPAQRLVGAIRQVDVHAANVTVSIGVAPVDAARGVEVALRRAEQALRRAKTEGKDQFLVWSDDDVVGD